MKKNLLATLIISGAILTLSSGGNPVFANTTDSDCLDSVKTPPTILESHDTSYTKVQPYAHYTTYYVRVNGGQIHLYKSSTGNRISYFTYTRSENMVGPGHVTRGNQVLAAQNILTQIYYDNKYAGTVLDNDGIYGTGTKNAIIKFQKNAGLTADGIIGPNTWQKLIKYANWIVN